jgi:hypothetical protein
MDECYLDRNKFVDRKVSLIIERTVHSRFDHFVHICTVLCSLLGCIRSVITKKVARVGRPFVEIVGNVREDIVQTVQSRETCKTKPKSLSI